MKFILAILTAACAMTGLAGLAAADTISGTVRYEDRTYDRNGFNGTQMLPVRFATVTVEVGNPVTQTVVDATDGAGFYEVEVDDVGSQQVRVIVSAESPDSEINGVIRVVNNSASIYAAAQTQTVNTDAAQGIDVDIEMADGDAANAMNIFDCCNWGNEYLFLVNGEFIEFDLTVRWADGLSAGTFYDTDLHRITLLGTVNDDDSYDDDIILHEYGHYIANTISTDDSPGGGHSVQQTNQDIRLAWSEGIAHYFSAVIRQYRGDAGSSDPADQVDNFNAVNSFFDLEDYESSAGNLASATNEIDAELAVAVVTWDIADFGGADDDDFDTYNDSVGPNLAASSNMVNDAEDFAWHVIVNRIPADTLTFPVQVSLENFFLLWYYNEGSYGNTGELLQDLFADHGMNYFEDGAEPDDTAGTAFVAATDGTVYERTFFSEDGADVEDTVDIFCFDAPAGAEYEIMTLNLANNCDTRIYVTTDGTAGTGLAQNKDANGSADVSSFLEWENDQGTGTYYVRVEREQATSASRNQARSRLGHYEFSITQTGGPTSPTAKLTANDKKGRAPHTVRFKGTGKATVAATVIVRYEYDFDGDGRWDYASANGGEVTHRYTYPGVFNARLRVTDSNGLTAIDTEVITVNDPDTSAVLSVDTDAPGGFVQGDDVAAFTVSVSMLPSNAVMNFFAFDFDGDGRWDMFENTTQTSIVAEYNFPCVNNDNDGSVVFQPRVFASFFDKKQREIILSALADEIEVNVNEDSPEVDFFEASLTQGSVPDSVNFDVLADIAGGSTAYFQYDFDGDGFMDTAPRDAAGGEDEIDFEYQQGGLYVPRVYVVDETLGLSTYSEFTSGSGVLTFMDNNFDEIRFMFVAPWTGNTVSGATGLAVRVFGGLSELPKTSKMTFQYRLGAGAFNDIDADVVRNGDLLSCVFDAGMLAEGEYDFGLLIDGDIALRDDYLLLDVNVVDPTGAPGNLGGVDGDVNAIGFFDERDNPRSFIEVANTWQGNRVTDGWGNEIFLPDGFTDVDDVTVDLHVYTKHLPAEADKPRPSGRSYGRAAVDLRIYEGEVDDEGDDAQINKPLRVRIAFDDSNGNGVLDGKNLDVETLEVYYYDPVEDDWFEISSSLVNVSDKYVEFWTTHLTLFGVFGVVTPIPQGGGDASPCFVATAAYGTTFAPAVDCLRDFRDDYLRQSQLGDHVVEMYYRASPPVADTIRESPILRGIARRWLKPLAEKFDKGGVMEPEAGADE